MLLSDLIAPGTYRAQDETDAFGLPVDELRAILSAGVDLQKGDKTALRGMRKPLLARMVARLTEQRRDAIVVRKGPRPRKPVATRVERIASGTRKYRRDCMKAWKHRAMAGNYHHKLSGR